MNTHQTCLICEERTGRCAEDSIFGHDGFGPLCERCHTALAAKFERMEALELEREVNRHLYGLLEKNVAQAISKVEHERDKVVGMLHELNELAKTAASNPLLLTEATFVVDEMLAGISLQNH